MGTTHQNLVSLIITLSGCGRIGIDPIEDDLPDADLAMTASPYRSTVLADSPLVLWSFEDEGQTAAPTVGTYTGAIAGAATRGVGAIGQGLVFDGLSTRLTAKPSGAAFVNTPVQTIELWLQPRTSDAQVRFVADCVTGTARHSVYAAQAFTIAERDLAGTPEHSVGPALSVGEFTHVVVTFDGARMTLYMNGTPYVNDGSATLNPCSIDGIVLGDVTTGSFYPLDATVDEVALYASVLPADRVVAHWEGRAR